MTMLRRCTHAAPENHLRADNTSHRRLVHTRTRDIRYIAPRHIFALYGRS